MPTGRHHAVHVWNSRLQFTFFAKTKRRSRESLRWAWHICGKGSPGSPNIRSRCWTTTMAELTLRGTIINEAEDLIHSDVHLVVGVPHFVHTEYLAPMAVGQVIRTIGCVPLQLPAGDVSDDEPLAMVTQPTRRPAMRPGGRHRGSRPPVDGDLDRALRQACPSWAGRRPPTTRSIRRRTSRSAAAKRRLSRCSYGRSTIRTSTAGRRRPRWTTRWCCTTRPTSLDDRPLSGLKQRSAAERRPAEIHAQGGPGRTAGHRGDQHRPRQDRSARSNASSRPTPPSHSSIFFDLVTLEGKLQVRIITRNGRRNDHREPDRRANRWPPSSWTAKLSVDPTKLQFLIGRAQLAGA